MKDRWSIAGDKSPIQIKNGKHKEDITHDNIKQDYLDDYNPNKAGTTPEPEYYTPSADFEKDCKDMPKMISGASREFDSVNPSKQQKQKSTTETVKETARKYSYGKQQV